MMQSFLEFANSTQNPLIVWFVLSDLVLVRAVVADGLLHEVRVGTLKMFGVASLYKIVGAEVCFSINKQIFFGKENFKFYDFFR